MTRQEVQLYRDSLNTPWGFRLQGGRDLGTSLAVQRVFAGSPAEADLQRGDVILAVENVHAHTLSHNEAENLIRQAGGNIRLTIHRDPERPLSPEQGNPAYVIPTIMAGRTGRIPTYGGPQQQFGVDYSKLGSARNAAADNAMMQRVNQSLDTKTYGGSAAPVTPADYFPPGAAIMASTSGSLTRKTPKGYGGGGPDMGWVAGSTGGHPSSVQQKSGTWQPPSHPTPPWNDSTYHGLPDSKTQPVRNTGGDSGVHHLQYNSPLGLYNRDAAKDALKRDVGDAANSVGMSGGRPADIVDSPTRSLVLQNDEWKAKTGHVPNMKDYKEMKQYGPGIAPMAAYKEDPIGNPACSDF